MDSVEKTFDVIVIGAGPAGENVADRIVQGGLSAVLIESELVGGECSYWACMPSKALLRSGAALRAAQKVDGSRQAVTSDLDVPAVLNRRNSFVNNWKDDGQVAWATLGSKITLLSRGSLLAGHEPFAGEMVKSALTKLCATVKAGVSPTQISRERTGAEVTISLDDGKQVVADELLVATGRTPRRHDLGTVDRRQLPG